MNENLLALVTAAVDGELSPPDELRFRRLMDSSPEARATFDRLKADSERLHNLPHVMPPANLHQRVMAKIATITPPPIILAPSPVHRPTQLPFLVEPSTTQRNGRNVRTQRWIPVAIAASLLFAIMGSSFWFFSGSGEKAGTIARNSNRSPAATRNGAGDSEWAKWLPPENSSRPVAPTPSASNRHEYRNEANNPPSQLAAPVAHETIAVAPSPREREAKNPNIYAAEPRPEIPPLGLVQIHVPFLKSLAEFDRDDTRQLFVEELGRDPAFRIDVFTRHLPHSVEWFRNAAKAANVTVAVDAATLDRVNKGQINSVVVYIESLPPAELADLFAKLCAEDAKITPRIFDAVHATPVSEDDNKALRNILGIDPGLFKRPDQEKSSDNPKPISAGTVNQIVKSLTAGQGKENEKSAMLMTWAPAVGRTMPNTSLELKQFLSKRGDRKANAVPVMIVIRHGNG
jgi:hypothetical protein